jgi:hypothetical protein
MEFRTRLAVAAVSAFAFLAVPVAALASPAQPANNIGWVVRSTGNYLYDADGGTQGNSFVTNSTRVTGLGPAINCHLGFCEHVSSSSGKCMIWQSTSNTITDTGTCSSNLQREQWSVAGLGNGWYEWLNFYADQVITNCGGFAPAMTANAVNLPVFMRCPSAGGGNLGNNQQWAP